MAYEPKPIDTSNVRLSRALKELVERLAENVHDTWAQQRMAEGWGLGPERNDARKEHPCLVPYAQLPESEKQYDRKTVTATVRTIVAMGYTIAKADEK